ncbi:hypothetical protein [Limnobacter sp.]|uniref:hypothetical protein n=2 Tax=Limnobacter sp. TaxID=2003368 RepID=UPI00258FC31D|nr:hypothetical protein [Limnobacter sp.]HEX5484598.1 hypothetical protein [Limnobacter sp.]
MKNYLLDLRQKLKPLVPVLSMSVHEHGCRWVYGMVRQSNVLSFNAIRCSGGSDLESGTSISGDSLNAGLLSGFIQDALGKISSCGLVKPSAVVYSIPASRAFMCELVSESGSSEEDLRFQIEDLLAAAVGDQTDEMVYDWQTKLDTSTNDQGDPLVVAAVLKKLLDEILQASKASQLKCLGVTLDNIAAVNGYLQAASKHHQTGNPKFLLYGEICKHRVRLAVFIEGFLCHESQDFSDQGFSVVQSVASLEKLVGVWARGDQDQGEGTVRLIVGGDLMASKTAISTIKRSRLLADKLFEIRPLPQIREHWHADVVAYGALEGMPCA